MKNFLRKHLLKIILIVLICGILFFISPYFIVSKYKKLIYTDISNITEMQVAIVFGSAVKPDGTPSDVLKDRLKIAADVYTQGKVQKIIVSGDNRFEHYNEPEGMYNYLVDTLAIPEDDVIADFAGRRTYDTCRRAHDLWDIEKAILITQGFHLPRALFLCNQLGIESYGISATLQPYVMQDYYKFREILAIYKSIIDLYIWEPSFVGGEKEDLNLQ
ncbi:hypothetical protein GF354_00065 [Candidatus Peregrinibacteria bacterium]|nr:hypothetical protein [Candidatus Peregrinibacteria bacterium]